VRVIPDVTPPVALSHAAFGRTPEHRECGRSVADEDVVPGTHAEATSRHRSSAATACPDYRLRAHLA
jgi:hypothetical protein